MDEVRVETVIAGELGGPRSVPLSTTVRDDPLFTATYREAVHKKIPIDARKAHQQHAREAEDGSLAPEDVER